jgi:hypothetical protein
MKTHPVIGKLKPDPVGQYLGTGFEKFNTGTVVGLARVREECLEILAIATVPRRRGHLRGFVRAAQKSYRAIRFLDVFNPQLDQALARYGFDQAVIREGWTGPLQCREWQQAPPQNLEKQQKRG